MELNKLSMIILMQTNLEEAVAFYKNLGLTLKFHMKDQWAEFAIGEIKLGLCPTQEISPERHVGLVFEVPDLYAAYEAMDEEGVEFMAPPVEKVHGIMVSFKDPSGNILDLYQPTPDKVRDLVLKAASEGQGQNTGCCGKQGDCCKAQA